MDFTSSPGTDLFQDGKLSFDFKEYRLAAILTGIISIFVLATAAIAISVINKSAEKNPEMENQFSGQKGFAVFMLIIALVLVVLAITVITLSIMSSMK